MHHQHLELLACPNCASEKSLELDVAQEKSGDVIDGVLRCPDCRTEFPIRNGIPRFVPEETTFDNFGYQWKRWRTIQIDRLSGHDLSERRFLNDSQWEPSWIDGRLILDAGCGAGRFADVVACHGGTVVACDISDAVDACRENTLTHGERVLCLQASIYALPLRRNRFDGVYCMGVIQHTPDPESTMTLLPRFLKPSGRLVYNFYERDFWPLLQPIKYALRQVTRRLPVRSALALSSVLVRLLFPLTRALSGIRYVRILNIMLPIAASHQPELSREQQFTWTLLDTVDWYGPRYEKRQDHRKVMDLLERLGLTNIIGSKGVVRATKP